jgi:hypothetical protein
MVQQLLLNMDLDTLLKEQMKENLGKSQEEERKEYWTDIDGTDITKMTAEMAVKAFDNHLCIVSRKIGDNKVEVFEKFIDWAFWENMYQTVQLGDALEKGGYEGLQLHPYSLEECANNAHNAISRLLEPGKECADSFAHMIKFWIHTSLSTEEDFLWTLVTTKTGASSMNKELGQFFTPPSLVKLLSTIVSPIPTKEFETFSPECLDDYGQILTADTGGCGMGMMIMGDWQQNHGKDLQLGCRIYYGRELDSRTAKACWLNISSKMIPACIDHGNAITYERLSPRWYTSAWLMTAMCGKWSVRMSMLSTNQEMHLVEPLVDNVMANPPFNKEFGLKWLYEQMMRGGIVEGENGEPFWPHKESSYCASHTEKD